MSLVHEIRNPVLSEECPICMDPLIDKEYITFNECNHKFHIKCLNEWKNKSSPDLIFHYKCPMCDTLRDINIERSLFETTTETIIFPRRLSFSQKIKRCFTNIIK